MKHRELSKLAKQLRSSFYGSDEWDTFTEEWEHVATHVRKMFERAADAASNYVCRRFDLQPYEIEDLKSVVTGVLPKEDKPSPFGCKCWELIGDTWVRKLPSGSLVLPHVDLKFCDMCGNPREEKA